VVVDARQGEPVSAVPMGEVAFPSRPRWLLPAHELPHDPVDMPLWNETYLTYGYSPGTDVGVYFHLRHVPGPDATPGEWDVVTCVTLPDERYLVSRIEEPGRVLAGQPDSGTGELVIGAHSWRCDRPYENWTYRFDGTARILTGEELWAGPVGDGPEAAVEFELDLSMMTPPWDHNTTSEDESLEEFESTYSKRHYAQHHVVTGHVAWQGNRIEVDGAGLRDHSWGPRDFTKMGHTTWIQGRIPEEGRAFSITCVPERAGHDGLLDPKVATRGRVRLAGARDLPIASTVAEALADCEFTLTLPDGTEQLVRSQVIKTMPMHFRPPSEFVPGFADGVAGQSHHYLPSFAIIEWDGQRCYGYNERCVRLGD
jgi:hypothetical protein